MTVIVELFGAARRLSGEKEVRLDVGADSSLRDALAALAERFPALEGELLAPGSYEPWDPYCVNIDGRRVVHDLNERIQEGQHLLLMFASLGG